jgi:hypothetical protein
VAIQEVPTPQHWNYFLALEDDIAKLARYIEPTQANLGVYSLELARILFGAASEVDVVAKQVCRRLDSSSRAASIGAYKTEICRTYRQLAESIIDIPRFGLTLTPWVNWMVDGIPDWWHAYNKVKHHRDTHFADASLKNSLNAVAGLFALLLFFYRDEAENGKLTPNPSLFYPGAPFEVEQLMWGTGANVYRLAI